MHDSTICFNGSADDIVILFQVDDYDFRRGGFVLLLADADEGIGFECLDSPSAKGAQQIRRENDLLTHELNPIDPGYRGDVSQLKINGLPHE